MIMWVTRGGSCFRPALVATTVLAALALQSCMEERCGPGQKQEGAACVAVGEDGKDGSSAGDTGTADTPVDAVAATADGAGKASLPAGMGEECSNDEGCKDKEAGYCSKKPLDAKGYCTTTGCTMGGSDCPEGYECFDLSGFGTDLQMCRKEG